MVMQRKFIDLPVDDGAQSEPTLPRSGHVLNFDTVPFHLVLTPVDQLGHKHPYRKWQRRQRKEKKRETNVEEKVKGEETNHSITPLNTVGAGEKRWKEFHRDKQGGHLSFPRRVVYLAQRELARWTFSFPR